MTWDYMVSAFDEFSLHYADEERRVFQDEPADLPLTPEREPERHTMNEWREIRIEQGECPMPGCGGNLDESFFCSSCSNVSLPAQKVPAERVTIPLPPHELPFDEYADAQVWDAA